MKEEIVSKSYAKSIIELGSELKVDVAEELTKLNEIINANDDLETLLFLDVFSIEEKKSVLSEIFKKTKLSPIVVNFVYFLLEEKRMGIFPMIFKNVIVIDDHAKGFLRGTIEGPELEITSDVKDKLYKHLKEIVGKDIQLDYKKSEKITAGYKVTVEDLQLDATLDTQLDNLKETILSE